MNLLCYDSVVAPRSRTSVRDLLPYVAAIRPTVPESTPRCLGGASWTYLPHAFTYDDPRRDVVVEFVVTMDDDGLAYATAATIRQRDGSALEHSSMTLPLRALVAAGLQNSTPVQGPKARRGAFMREALDGRGFWRPGSI